MRVVARDTVRLSKGFEDGLEEVVCERRRTKLSHQIEEHFRRGNW